MYCILFENEMMGQRSYCFENFPAAWNHFMYMYCSQFCSVVINFKSYREMLKLLVFPFHVDLTNKMKKK